MLNHCSDITQDVDPDAQMQPARSKSWFAKLGKPKVPLMEKGVREGYHERTSSIAKKYGSEKMV
jgi:hypothetical protein